MKNYFFLQVKRMKACIPYLLCYLLLVATGIGCVLVFMQTKSDSETQKIPIGIVGNLSEDYFNIGFVAIKRLDSSKHTIELFRMSEEEAKEALQNGTLAAYAVIPEGFVESVFYGKNKQIIFVTASASYDLGNQIIEELTAVISELLIETQNAIYGMQQFAEDKGFVYQQSDAVEELNLRYIRLVLERPDLFEINYLSEISETERDSIEGPVLIEGEESLKRYYSCAFFVVLLSFWGMGCVKFAIRQEVALARFFRSRGYKPVYLVVGEYSAYALWLLGGAGAIAGIAGCFGILIGMDALFLPVGKLFPVVLALAAMQFLLYECTRSMISAVLLQFIAATVCCYVTGCFYPVTFFPKMVQQLSYLLPQGASLQYLLTKEGQSLLVLLGTVVICVGTAVLIRTKRMEGNMR